MSGQGVGGETSKEKGLNSGNKACCSGWEGPPLPGSVFILMTETHSSAGLTDTHLSREQAPRPWHNWRTHFLQNDLHWQSPCRWVSARVSGGDCWGMSQLVSCDQAHRQWMNPVQAPCKSTYSGATCSLTSLSLSSASS